MPGTIYDAVMGAYDQHVARQNAVQDRKYEIEQRDQRQNALGSLIKEYGPQAAMPEQAAQLATTRIQQTNAATAQEADQRGRQVQAQRAGIGVARQILDLPPEQQDAAMQQYAPVLAQAFGVKPEEIFSSIGAIRNSPDPAAALDALDQQLAPQSEREIGIRTQSQEEIDAANNARALEVARATNQSREDVAALRGRQTNTSNLSAMQAASGVADQAIKNIDDNITPFINRRSNENFLGANVRHFLEQNLAGTEGRGFQAAINSLKGSLSVNDIRNMRATGVRLGNTTMREFTAAADALAALDTGQSMGDLRTQIARAREALDVFRTAMNADIAAQQAGREPSGGLAFPQDAAAPADANGAAPADGTTPAGAPAAATDDLAAFLGRR